MSKSKGTQFRRIFTHWRNGRKYDARDYGHEAWPIGRKQGK
ncbi:MAG: hypothetical protein ACLPVW_03855 [Terriglobales bacterium]